VQARCKTASGFEVLSLDTPSLLLSPLPWPPGYLEPPCPTLDLAPLGERGRQARREEPWPSAASGRCGNGWGTYGSVWKHGSMGLGCGTKGLSRAHEANVYLIVRCMLASIGSENTSSTCSRSEAAFRDTKSIAESQFGIRWSYSNTLHIAMLQHGPLETPRNGLVSVWIDRQRASYPLVTCSWRAWWTSATWQRQCPKDCKKRTRA
jgi:hypothetical protein